ncbi:hypothetical protein KIH87_04415 [Paraneptunicella aestuarii]|uniref:hypothetical protein n=1 Tax=Paraneptunicella aestuarii TaxID=2831148 RepID=UPI001E40163B|nr:hypothetical protein [Paraneptunicella aestuarii]UAA39609.1 hypothetical protein KIH87_04415 [Paraneptunicella aestuarii]
MPHQVWHDSGKLNQKNVGYLHYRYAGSAKSKKWQIHPLPSYRKRAALSGIHLETINATKIKQFVQYTGWRIKCAMAAERLNQQDGRYCHCRHAVSVQLTLLCRKRVALSGIHLTVIN